MAKAVLARQRARDTRKRARGAPAAPFSAERHREGGTIDESVAAARRATDTATVRPGAVTGAAFPPNSFSGQERTKQPMHIRPELKRLILGHILAMAAFVAALMLYCLALDMQSVHLAVLAVLTTTGPLVSRIFEGLIRRRQRVLGLPMDCLEADDEVLLARTLPLALPVIGTLFAWFVVL